ncbi:Multidrug resistance efflux pump [Roseibium alexandrii DFL-11]|uniref:Multidrug resistance efflux pump n=2 Tax=Roseibium alexandrii TaxID=388408 RepID=A0A5E8GXK5_ROSAD|nr:Multidrug resistance efflux pump [Roseibium alexandrii DFL-11]
MLVQKNRSRHSGEDMLFRKQVIEAKRTRLYGDVLIVTPVAFKVIAVFLFGILVAVGLFLGFGNFARLETVRGAVIPSNGMIHVRPASSGYITDFAAQEGEYVREGQELGRLVVADAATDDGSETAARLAAHERQISNLDDEIIKMNQLNRVKLDDLKVRTSDAQIALENIKNQIAIQETLVVELKGSYQRASDLSARGHVSGETRDVRNIRLLTGKQDLQRLLSDQNDLEAELRKFGRARSELIAQNALDVARLEAQKEKLLAEKDIFKSQKVFKIVAPISGYVTTVLASRGAAVRSEHPLFSILPENSVLQVELYVPSRAIGFVEEGLAVRIQFDSFPFERFGAQAGTVRLVTRSVLSKNDPSVLVQTGEPIYRVNVDLAASEVSAYGRSYAIQPGMLLSANIILEDRSILSWLLEPMIAVARRS